MPNNLPKKILFLLSLLGLTASACGEEEKETGADTGAPTVVDADGDGYEAALDCDDQDASVHPDAQEICNGEDDNCDNQTDEGLLVILYDDSDGDGYGAEGSGVEGCAGQAGKVEVGGDCDDNNSATNPGAAESCDGLDNNCNSQADEGLEFHTWYLDVDQDGYGDPEESTESCDEPDGWVDNGDDCNDLARAIHPGATEICDHLDNDCDAWMDDGLPSYDWFLDADGDGYGAPDGWVRDCMAPVGHVNNDRDCDDSRPGVHPDAEERCDGLDNNCSGVADDGPPADAHTWFADLDGDNYGAPGNTVIACDRPDGYLPVNTDCDDANAAINPSAQEVCDSSDVDQDCDGLADDEDPSVFTPSMSTWYPDVDRDSYGDANSAGVQACDQARGTVADNTDCDDNQSMTHPGAPEFCDGADNDCNGKTDESSVLDGEVWYDDDDSDGYGDASDTKTACTQPSGYVANDQDCDDHDRSVTIECWDTAVEVPFWDGTYVGTISVDATLTAIGLSDTCVGSMTIYVEEASTPQIRGSGTCTFTGTLAGIGAQSGIVDGNLTTDPWAEGNIWVGTSISDTWRGKFINDFTLEAAFSGSTSISGFAVTYSGDVSVSR